MKETISLRMNKDLAEKLMKLSKRTDLSVSRHMRLALELYLRAEMWNAEIVEVAEWTESSDEEINFDLEHMKKAIEGPYRKIPSGLTREEFREWMMKDADESQSDIQAAIGGLTQTACEG